VEIFRTTPARTVCPNFYVLAHANGCGFQPKCSYCYLVSSFWYLDRPHVFTNLRQLESEVRRWLRRDDLESYVLNTGNLSDSLTFEQARPLFARLIEIFRTESEAKGRKHTLLLVTKGGVAECRGLLDQPACGNVIVSFSVNHPEAARAYEAGAAATADRLAAARRLQGAGWRVRIRIDPMIVGFDYADLVREVRDLVPERVTLGTLRAEPGLLHFMHNGLFRGLEKPEDEKSLARYPWAGRLALYGPAVRALVGVCPVGLCEETPEMWAALGLPAEAKSCNCGE